MNRLRQIAAERDRELLATKARAEEAPAEASRRSQGEAARDRRQAPGPLGLTELDGQAGAAPSDPERGRFHIWGLRRAGHSIWGPAKSGVRLTA